MTVPIPDETLLQAGSLVFAMLRFAEGAAHPSRGATPPGRPRLGAEAYIFAPASRLVPHEEVPAFLASLPSPAMLLSSTTRGVVALLLLDELSGERAAPVRHNLANQRAALDEMTKGLGLTEESRILLEFGDEEVIVSLAVLRLWSERFVVDVGWSVGSLHGDARAAARLHLFRSDGVDAPSGPERDSMIAVTADVPIAYHTDAVGFVGPNAISVWWLQRRADVKPDPEHGIYQFDALRLLPPRSTLEEVVKERYPSYARVGLTEMEEIPLRNRNAPFDPTPEECIVPWFIANDEGTVLESWLGPYLQHPIVARQMIEARHPNVRFTSVRIGEIAAEKASRAPIVWATLDASTPLP